MVLWTIEARDSGEGCVLFGIVSERSHKENGRKESTTVRHRRCLSSLLTNSQEPGDTKDEPGQKRLAG